MNHHLPQLQYQTRHHIQSQIPAIAASWRETAIYFLQFLLVNDGNPCNIDIRLLVEKVVGDIVNVIPSC